MAIYMYKQPDYLCFTAEEAWSTVRFRNNWWSSIGAQVFETSTDWDNRSTYSWNSTITLTNIWDKVYFRSASETKTYLSISTNNYCKFLLTWKIAASWDINYLFCKNNIDVNTDTIWNYSFYELFYNCSSLTKAPKLPAKLIWNYAYNQMFMNCTGLTTAPELPATSIWNSGYAQMFSGCENLTGVPKIRWTTINASCYSNMFVWCSKLKFSNAQTSDYTQPYRLPYEWSYTASWSQWTTWMLTRTWWTFTSNPSLGTTYYVHKDNIIV